jgi:hypothetical protein
MSGSVTSSISSNVKYSCDSTATEDIASAIAVFDFYCSAARAEVTAGGVTDSVAQTYPTAAAGNTGVTGSGGAKPTASRKGTGADGSGSTGSPVITGAAGSGGGGNETTGKSTGNGPKPAVVAGAVVGVVGGLAGLGVLIWFLVRHSRKKAADTAALAAAHANLYNNGPDQDAKPELGGNPITAMPPASPSPSTLEPSATVRTESASPASAHGGAGVWAPPPPPDKAELHGQAASYPPMPSHAAELPVQAHPGSPYVPRTDGPELMGGQEYPLQELPSSTKPAPVAGYQLPPELAGQQGYAQGYQQGQAYPMRAQEYNGHDGQQYSHEASGQPVYEFPGQQGVYPGTPGPLPPHGQQYPQPQAGWPVAELDGRYGHSR